MRKEFRVLLFGFIMVWTGVTTLYAWIPVIRIVGRPEGNVWRVLDWSGVGAEGPYWILLAASVYVWTLLFAAFRGPEGSSRSRSSSGTRA